MLKQLLASCFAVFFCSAQMNAQPGVKETPYQNGEVLIQLAQGYSINDVVGFFPAELEMRAIKCLSSHMRYWQLGFNHTVMSNTEVLRKMDAMKQVRIAQNNHFIEERLTVPNDPSFTSQWHHKNTGASGGTVDADIDSDEAWDITTGGLTNCGDTIVVALVEGGGAFYNHADLKANFWHNYEEIPGNGIDDDGNGYTDDFDGWDVLSGDDNHSTGGHGTQCFGMMGARGNNTLGVSGINWNVKVMLVSGFGVDEAGVIAAYDYPLTMRKRYNQTNGASGAFVVATSASWGIDYADPAAYPLWCNYYDTLGAFGILNVGATTNNTVNVDAVGDMPTACSSPYMVSVTRTGNTDNQAGGYGLTTIDFGAPGINVYTTSGTSSSTYGSTTGTSFSCPLTAGTIALMYSVPCESMMNLVKTDPQAGADYILAKLMAGVDVVTSMTGKSVTNGRLNAYKCVNGILTACTPLTCNVPTGVSAVIASATSVNLTWTNGGNSVAYYYYYRPVGAPTWDSVYTMNTNATIGSLTACTNYEFMVAGICCDGPGSYSSIVTAMTDCCNVPPTGLSASATGETSGTATWTAVAGATYTIQYVPTSGGTTVTVTSGTNAVNLTGLAPCTQYNVQIQANCSVSNSTYTSTATFTTDCCTTAPTSITTSAVTVTTTDVTFSTVGGATSYNLQYKPVASGTFITLMGVTSPYTLTGLDTCTAYEVQVQADCGAGGSTPFTASTNFTTTGCGTAIAEATNNISIGIYPNPATDEFTVSVYSEPVNTGTITLTNALGEVVNTTNLGGKSTVVKTFGMANGVYSYLVKLSDGRVRKGRIVISR
ncbi:MAG TPA: fibronectin type III domain-containing protein [Flavobacteriales bacterium]|nr:fibronectin type III domain-containing protein [Flavobacteriales bacterium]